MAPLQASLPLLLWGQAIWGVGESVKKHLLSVEDLSFSLREAKPKRFGLEMFAVVLEPCLLAAQLCPGESPSTGTLFPLKHPCFSEGKAVTRRATWISPSCFSFFLLKFFCVEAKSRCFLESPR